MRSAVEREVKLGAPVGFVVPDLGAVIDGGTVRAADARILDATYYDARDLRLIRDGVTLRHRTGDAPGEGTWTVKLPEATPVDGGLARTELEVDGPAGAVPAAVATMVEGRVPAADLVAVARLRTTRRRLLLVARGGVEVAEVADDDVEVLDGDRVVASFREVEVELLAPEHEAVLAAVVDALRSAGAGAPDPTPKLGRALRLMARRDDVVRAAGGVVWRDGGDGIEVLVVHRPKYDDWSLPKGKRDPGETDEQCAVREVDEETGLRATLGRELLPTRYRDRKDREKVVRYWAMTVASGPEFTPNDEVDELRWLGLDEAAALLSYDHDVSVVRSFAR